MYSKTIFLFSIASFLLLAVAVDARSVEVDDEEDYSDELIDDEEALDDFIAPDEIDYIISDMEEKLKSKKKSRRGRESSKYPQKYVRNCMKWDLC